MPVVDYFQKEGKVVQDRFYKEQGGRVRRDQGRHGEAVEGDTEGKE